MNKFYLLSWVLMIWVVSAQNNETHKQKIRVLYLEGNPRWEYRFLKNALIQDNDLEVNCFLFSADPDFAQETSSGLKALTAFPDKEKLATYDVILFGDIEPFEAKLSSEQQKNLIYFVEYLGGGIGFISGSFTPHSYAQAPLEMLLPIVTSDKNSIREEESVVTEFNPKLTAEGIKHPTLRLVSDPHKNKELIEKELPGFFWNYPTNKLKPGAISLLERKVSKEGVLLAEPEILMATQHYGKGRSLFVGLDSTWRWRYIVGNLHFYKFWKQSILYLSAGRKLSGKKHSVLQLDNSEYRVGENVSVLLKIKNDPTFVAKTQHLKVNCILEKNISGMISEESKEINLTAIPNEPGSFEGQTKLTEAGNYKIYFKKDGEFILVAFQVISK